MKFFKEIKHPIFGKVVLRVGFVADSLPLTVKSAKAEIIFSSQHFFQKTNKQIQLYYYDTSGRLVFVRFLEEIEHTKKTFQN